MAHERAAVEHRAAPPHEPRSAHQRADGTEARRGAGRDPGVNARDLGIQIGELDVGPNDAITDVAGVRVGHTTLIEGDRVRTGVTVVLPTPDGGPCFAAAHRLNGNGELTGLE